MNRRGFTLVELLVTVAVMGIITGLSIPVIRNINQQRINKKYTTYLDSLTYAAKLYTDSYSEDLFAYSTGCEYVKYENLTKYNLIKDIDLSGISCNSPYTAVKVVKFKEKYYYKPYIGCGKKGASGKPDIFMPEELNISAVCDSGLSANIMISGNPSTKSDKTLKTIKSKLVITSETGVYKDDRSPNIEYGWSYVDQGINVINGKWTKIDFDIFSESRQTEMIASSETQVFASKSQASTDVLTSNKPTGKINLVVHVINLLDLQRQTWTKIEKPEDNYVIIGPFMVDNAPPKITGNLVTSVTGYQNKKPKLNFSVTDEGFSEVSKGDIKYCYKYGTSKCTIPANTTALKNSTDYKAYSAGQVLDVISSAYDGSTKKANFVFCDAAANCVEVNGKEYRVANKYTLTFDPNGGSKCDITSIGQIENQPWNKAVVDETGLNVHKFCTTTRTGYTVDGWFTNQNGTGTQVKVTDKATANTKVYAKWKPKTIVTTFNCNGGNGGGDQTFTYGVSGQKFAKTCTRTGYNLAGWKLAAADKDKRYTVDNGVSNEWIDTNSPKITLYAHWVPKTVVTTFDCNGGTGGGSQTFTYGVSGQAFNKTCTRSGYKLLGWKLDKNGANKDYNVNNGVSDGWIDLRSPSVTIYAHWVPESYKCNAGQYLAKSATSCAACPISNYCAGGTYTYSTTADQGKTACPTGYGNTSGTGKSKNTECYMSVAVNKYVKNARDSAATNCATGYERAGHTVYYGSVSSCALTTYTIGYNLGGGSASNPTSYNITSNAITLNNPTRTGYTFAGWTGTGLSSATKTVTIPKGSTGNRSYTATWTANTYTVSYAGGGATGGSTAASTCTYGSTFTPRANGFTRTGHTFNGWSGSTTCTGNMTMTATWKANTYTVSYAGGGATGGSTAASTCTYGQAISARGNGFVRSHYHFNGWSGLGTCTGNKTLTATWAPNVAIVRYHTGTSSGSQLKYKPSGWSIKNDYQIWNATTQDIHTVPYGTSDDPINYHNTTYLYVKKTRNSNGSARNGAEWKICNGATCTRSTYNEDTNYSSEQYCNTTNGNCYCCIKVNWN